MAGVFDGLEVGSPGNLSPAELQQVMGLRDNPNFFAQGSGQSDYWYDPSKTYDAATDTHGFMLEKIRGYRNEGVGDASGHVWDPSLDTQVIRRLRAGAAGKMGDSWDPKTGKYLGTYEAQDGGGRQMNKAILMIASALGTQYLQGLNGAESGLSGMDLASDSASMWDSVGKIGASGGSGASTVGLDVSNMPVDWGTTTDLGTIPSSGVDASGMPVDWGTTTDLGTIPSSTGTGPGLPTGTTDVGTTLARDGVRGAVGYGTEGMTGLQTSTFDAVLQATGSVEAATMATKVVEAGGTLVDAYNAVDRFMNTGLGKVLGTGLTLAATKDAEVAPNDPALDKGITDTKAIGDTATNRAAADDEFFRNTFLPRYLGLMDRADRRDQELYDWNMGRARRAAGQMDQFYSAVDNYDSEGNRRKLRGEAGATAQQASDAQLQQILRDLNRRGVNPNDGQAFSNMRQWGQNAALTKAHAMNLAGEAARREGLNLRATAAGLRGSDMGYAGNAAAGANMGLSALQAGQSGFNANTSATNSTSSLGLDAARTYGGWGLSRTNSADQVSIANTGGWNSLLGYGLGQLWNRSGG